MLIHNQSQAYDLFICYSLFFISYCKQTIFYCHFLSKRNNNFRFTIPFLKPLCFTNLLFLAKRIHLLHKFQTVLKLQFISPFRCTQSVVLGLTNVIDVLALCYLVSDLPSSISLRDGAVAVGVGFGEIIAEKVIPIWVISRAPEWDWNIIWLALDANVFFV